MSKRRDPTAVTTTWRRFLHGPRSALLTHGSLAVLTILFFAMLLRLPFWLAFVPCAIVQHRIGVLLHEYIHGIPCHRYQDNLRVLTLFDGLLLMFGLVELFRGTHLAHHRWLNTERDPAYVPPRPQTRGLRTVGALEAVQHVIYLFQSLRGRHPYVRPARIGFGALVSCAVALGWVAAGHASMPAKLIALALYNTLIPISFRGAVEHHSHAADPSFANEYRVVIPLFNLNKHIHHHEEPRRPWYLLEYRTARPLSTFHYFTHWFKVYITQQYVLMKPSPSGRRSGSHED